MIYDDGYELDEKGRALICPRCGNEQMAGNGRYCRICSSNLVNRCINDGDSYDSCGKIAPGNARYCEYCGCETTFFKDELLKPWKEAKEEILSRQSQAKKPLTSLSCLPFEEWNTVLNNLKSNGRMALFTYLYGTKAFVRDNMFLIVFETGNTLNKMVVSKAENLDIIQEEVCKCLNIDNACIKLINEDDFSSQYLQPDNELESKVLQLANRLNVPLNIIDE